MIDIHSKYDNMHKNEMFYTLIFINNHEITIINCMLSVFYNQDELFSIQFLFSLELTYILSRSLTNFCKLFIELSSSAQLSSSFTFVYHYFLSIIFSSEFSLIFDVKTTAANDHTIKACKKVNMLASDTSFILFFCFDSCLSIFSRLCRFNF